MIARAGEALMIDGRPALTAIDPALIGDIVFLLVRDPLCGYTEDPATELARRLDGAECVSHGIMFTAWTGSYQGARITMISGGSGGPEAELALHELITHTSATTFIRLGGSGGANPLVHRGDVVIARGVIRDEAVSTAYAPDTWPGACSIEVTTALAQAAWNLQVRHHVGLIRSCDSDIIGAGRPGVGGYLPSWADDRARQQRDAGALCTDRESAAIVTIAQIYGRRAGSICSVADNPFAGDPFQAGAGHAQAVDVALEGAAILHRMDIAAQANGAPMWLPSFGGLTP